jgi:hypothetical protein
VRRRFRALFRPENENERPRLPNTMQAPLGVWKNDLCERRSDRDPEKELKTAAGNRDVSVNEHRLAREPNRREPDARDQTPPL